MTTTRHPALLAVLDALELGLAQWDLDCDATPLWNAHPDTIAWQAALLQQAASLAERHRPLLLWCWGGRHRSSSQERRWYVAMGCAAYVGRGASICSNRFRVSERKLNASILGALREVLLAPGLLRRIVDRFDERLDAAKAGRAKSRRGWSAGFSSAKRRSET